MDDAFDLMLERARIMSCATRVLLWEAIGEGGAYPDELVQRFELAPSTVSFHLRCLHQAGLVRIRYQGRRRLYESTGVKLALVTPDDLEALNAAWANP